MSQAAAAERYTDDMQKPPSGVSLRVVFNAIRRHPFACTGVLLFSLGVGLGIWFFLPLPKKTAVVVFHVSPRSPDLLKNANDGRADYASYKQSQIALLKSRRTLSKALSDDAIKSKKLAMLESADPDVMTWLENHVQVESKLGSEHIRVTVEGDSDEELLALLGSIQRAFLALAFDADNGARIKRHLELENGISERRRDIQNKQDSIKTITKIIGGKEASQQAVSEKLLLDEFLKAADERAVVELEYQTLLADLSAAKAEFLASRQIVDMAVAGTPWVGSLPQRDFSRTERVATSALEEALRQDRKMQELEARVTQANENLRKTIDRYLPGTVNESIAKAKSEVKSAEEERDAYRSEAEARISAALRLRVSEMAYGRMAKLQVEHDRSKAKRDRAMAKESLVLGRIDNYNLHKAQLEELINDIAHKEKLLGEMTDEYERVKLELRALKAQPRVAVHDEPYIFNGIEGNRRLKYALMAGLGALVLGFGGLVGWEHRSRRVTRAEEVTTELGARLIGTIPPLAAATGVPSQEDNTPLVEAIDTTRIMLTHAGADGSKLRVLMVTSAVSGEGKTTLSGNLAISLTRAGFRTLLIDGDMQAPSAHLLFDIPDAPGLSELLRGEASLARAVRPSPIPGLSILPAGRWNISTRQSLVGDRWRSLKRQLESEFDFVVIDTSPLLMVSDAMLLAREADGVVLSVLLGVSQIARVAETVNRLQAIGAQLAGVVVNNVQSEVYRRYMARSKYSALAPVAAEREEMAYADEEDGGLQEVMAEEIESSGKTKEG